MGSSSKDSRQNLHLRRNTRGNLSTFRRTFNFSFGVHVGGRAVVVQTLFISSRVAREQTLIKKGKTSTQLGLNSYIDH